MANYRNIHHTAVSAKQRSDAPLPKVVYRVMNPIFGALLRSPLHGLISKSLMLLTFTGHKSGRRYTIPVGYLEKGDHLYLFTRSRWWRNLIGGAPVSVRLRELLVRGLARPIDDHT